MASLIVVKNANFSDVALDQVTVGEEVWTENNFTWDNGGIYNKGTSSGTVGIGMSMVSPLPYAFQKTVVKVSNGYKIYALLIDTTNTAPNTENYNYTHWDSDNPDSIEIPAGYYWQVCLTTISGENADLSEGYKSLLIRE